MGTINVDQVSSYALTVQDKVIQVDQVSAYALVAGRSAAAFTIDYKQHIANSIKSVHNVTLAVSDFDLGTPVTKANGRFNAEIPFTVKPSSGYRGTINLAYMRYPIADFTYGRDLDTFKYVPGAVTTRDMLDAFNTKFGTKIARTEIVDETLNPTGDTIFKASADSVFFEPGSQVNMGVIVASARDHEIAGLVWPPDKELLPLLTLGLDFTSIRNMLNAVTVKTQINTSMATTLANAANSLGGYSIFSGSVNYNTYGGLASCYFEPIDLPNAAYPQCDQTGRFDRAILVTCPVNVNQWFTEPFVIQYNR